MGEFFIVVQFTYLYDICDITHLSGQNMAQVLCSSESVMHYSGMKLLYPMLWNCAVLAVAVLCNWSYYHIFR
jgi:hypothetical protein